jgi:GT2 family glycosyltransferase
VKVAICTPLHGDPKAGYVNSLADLLLAARAPEVELRFCRCSSSNVVRARTELARIALEWGADHLLWLDSDQTFPPNTLARLLSTGQAIVGCNISTRAEPCQPTARDPSGRLVHTTPEEAARNVLQEVGSIGFGVLLTAAELFAKLPRPWFLMPDDQGTIIGEDYYFCRQARAAGYRIYVDQGLSMQIGHIGERVFRITDALPAAEA